MLFTRDKIIKAIQNSVLLTVCVFILSSPYLYHFIVHNPDVHSPFSTRMLSLPDNMKGPFVLVQLIMYIVLIFLCSMIGFGYSQKYSLGGFGKLHHLKRDMIYILLICLPAGLLIYFAYDRFLIEAIPSIYPKNSQWGFAKALMTSSTYEIVSKFGLVTVVMGIFKNRHIAVLLPALFFTALIGGTFSDYRVDFGINYLSIAAVITSLFYNIVSGYVYAYRGLLTVFALRFVLDMKYMIYAFIN